MAGVHRLKQIERLGSADFADDDAFRSHTQTILDQIAHRDLTFAFDIRRSGFKTHHMRLLQLQFGCVFAGDDAFVVIDIICQAVQQRSFTGARTAGNQYVGSASTDDLQNLRAFRRDSAEFHKLVECQLVLLEFTNGKCRAVDGQRRHNGVNARAVGKTRVADRRRFVDAAADLADDALADIEQLLVVAKANSGTLNFAGYFDVNRARAIDHDVGDIVTREQRLQRAVTENVVTDVVEQFFLLGN